MFTQMFQQRNHRNYFIHAKEQKPHTKLQPLQMIWFAVLLAGCTIAPVQALPRPEVPQALRVQQEERLAFTMDAEGVQIYQCQPSADDATKYGWTFRAPEAALYDAAHNEVGSHYGGPTWKASDGSTVIAEVAARADAPEAEAIPWLLLKAKSVEGPGLLGNVTSIQRIKTSGGTAPQSGCDSTHEGEEARVPYTAVYAFYTMSESN